MGVYYYIVNRTLKQRIKKHYGKWGEFDFESTVEYLCEKMEGWSKEHDIWAIGDDYSNTVKYYPRVPLSEEEMEVAMEEFKEIWKWKQKLV